MPCITYMWNLKYSTNEPMYKTERDSQTERIDLWVTRRGTGWKEKDGFGVWDWQMQTIIFRMYKQGS